MLNELMDMNTKCHDVGNEGEIMWLLSETKALLHCIIIFEKYLDMQSFVLLCVVTRVAGKVALHLTCFIGIPLE